ncbi:MAG: DUF3604 domain-containing protein [Pseudomonadota bacterium]|nr:DUF3604 domain-containing protein [Pseudomonadota bacterium]
MANLPPEVDYRAGTKAMTFEDLRVDEEGLLRIQVMDGAVATAGPLVIRAGALSGYWGDLHGQSGESIGVTTARQYFDFARNKSFLDATAHQANDFQVNNAFWAYLNELTAEYHADGRFVTFPGYEWSGNTAVGGDRNVFIPRRGSANPPVFPRPSARPFRPAHRRLRRQRAVRRLGHGGLRGLRPCRRPLRRYRLCS